MSTHHLDQPGISTARQEISAAGPNVQGCALGVETPNDSKRGGPRPANQACSYTPSSVKSRETPRNFPLRGVRGFGDRLDELFE